MQKMSLRPLVVVLFSVVLVFFGMGLPATAQTPVSVGSGSYASFPPASEDSAGHSVSGTVNQSLYLDASQVGKPVPTNKWWTDLLISQYSGSLWANPLVVSNSVNGSKIFYPNRWNTDGTARVLESEIEVQGTVSPITDPSDIVMADFEGSSYPAGWTTTGTAFGSGPANGTLSGQSVVSGFLNSGLANSFNGGDASVGSLNSPLFTVDRNYISFLVGGGNHPGQTEVRLVIGGTTVLSATGVNSESLRWVTWDVSAYAGQTAQIQIVDSLSGGWAHILADQIFRTNSTVAPADRYKTSFAPADARVLSWGDWNVSWRMQQSTGGQSMDVTLARGIPYVWFEFNNVSPRIKVLSTATFQTAAGATLTFPATTDRFIIVQDGRKYGIHAPAGSSFTLNNNVIQATLTANYLVVSAVPAGGLSLDTLHTYAFAVPRNTQMNWSYSAAAGAVTTNWSITTSALQGTNLLTIQGWLPHHYRGTTNNLSLQGFTYDVPRGVMKCTIGNGNWSISYPFEGIAPVLPKPEVLGKPADYVPTRMSEYVNDYATIDTYGGDTYWGGKSLQQFGHYMLMAKQIGETDAYNTLKSSLRTALTDWYTYTPDESEIYFARYDTWKALIGFNDSYGSYQFVDNHFHYGYFTLASALLNFEDPTFAAQYGPMATLVAKQYANWDRNDLNFPFMRTFDAWEGHSYAGGFSSPGGNNQESSSEAIQSWAGLFLLGSSLGNADMQAAGAMGYATERSAVREYWWNYHGNPNSSNVEAPGVFPSNYAHTTTGILFDSGQAYATYFSADPAWIYGIQWMPTAPHFAYFAWDQAFSKSLMKDMFDQRPIVLGQFVKGDNGGQLINSAKQWYGVGFIYGGAVTLDQNASIASIEAGIRNAYLNNPAYTTVSNSTNPLYNTSTGSLYFTVNQDGTLSFPSTYWTPSTLPSAFVPPQPPAGNPDAVPAGWALYDYLSTNYTPSDASLQSLYNYNVATYTPGVDTAQATKVYSRMGDALGNVVLGFASQYDPDFVADVHNALWNQNDPAVRSNSMAGIVYYNAMSNRGLGVPVPGRHTSLPTSQVFYNAATNKYSYVAYNPSSSQQAVTVYDGASAIGIIQVPAKTLVNHHLDQALDRIVITPSNTAKTIQPGQSVQFTAIGYDQYNATYPLGTVAWSVNAGSINTSGQFTAGPNADPVIVTATSGGKTQTYAFRVGATPVLSQIAISPTFQRVVAGATQSYTASGYDQYGDSITMGSVAWSTTATGNISSAGVFTAGSVSTGYIQATSGSLTGSSVVAVIPTPTNIALGKTVTFSSQLGANTAARAVDGNTGTRWESSFADNQSLTVDLGARYDISRVYINWEPAYAATWQLQVADFASGPWTTVASPVKTSPAADDLTLATTGRYVRMNGLTRATNYGFSIWEFEVYGVLNGDNVVPTKVMVNPSAATIIQGKDQLFQGYAFDASSNGGLATVDWSVSGGGTINSAGLFSATTVGGPFSVTATKSGVSGSGQITVTSAVTAVPVNVALGKSVTVSSTENGGTPGTKAVDGSLTTRWSSAFTDNESIEVDLGSILPLSQVILRWEGAYGKNYTIQVRNTTSDTWTTVVTRTNGTGGNETFDLNVSGRFVRMVGTLRGTQYGYSLWEFEIYSPSTSQNLPNLALNQPTTASSTENGGTGAAKATDGSSTTRWSSAATDTESITVDLGASKALSSIKLFWEAAYGKNYTLEGSQSATGPWTVLASRTNGAGGTETYNVTGSYQYVKMNGSLRGTQYGYSLWEFEIR